MEKTITMNVKVAGFHKEKEMVQGPKRDHVKIWREILRDVRSQWEEAEYGKSHTVPTTVQGTKRDHVAIWREIFRDVRSQWTQAEHGRFHSAIN